jgi:hypothetical protein
MNYPGESPVFDFWSYTPNTGPSIKIYGIFSIGDSYLTFKGLHVRRVWHINTDNGRAHGFYLQTTSNITWDQCKADSIAGRGFQLHDASGQIRFYNCDAWWCADPQDSDPGNAGTGFLISGTVDVPTTDSVILRGCRGWYNADQSFGAYHHGFVWWDSCWSVSCGHVNYTSGSGHGFKIGGGNYDDYDPEHRLHTRCIAAFNKNMGFTENNGQYMNNSRIYNNTSILNESLTENSTEGAGFHIYDPNQHAYYSDGNEWDNHRVYHNNLAYGNYFRDVWKGSDTTATGLWHSYNSWDAPYTDSTGGKYQNSPATVNAADFKAVPTSRANCVAIISAARKADGSLPDLGDYFQLAEGSDLIDQGKDVGLSYNGTAPDLGAFESDYGEAVTRKVPHLSGSGKMLLNSSGDPLYIKE